MNIVKFDFLAVTGAAGGAFSYLFGGWDNSVLTLLVFMGIDYVTGLIVAGVFKSSGKTNNGALESHAGWKGLCKKGVTLMIVVVANLLDLTVGTDVIRDAVIIAFIANETLSIVENAGLMGIPVPLVIKNAIEVLNNKNNNS